MNPTRSSPRVKAALFLLGLLLLLTVLLALGLKHPIAASDFETPPPPTAAATSAAAPDAQAANQTPAQPPIGQSPQNFTAATKPDAKNEELPRVGEFVLSETSVFWPDTSQPDGGSFVDLPTSGLQSVVEAVRNGAKPVMVSTESGARPRLLTNRISARLSPDANPSRIAQSIGAIGWEKPDFAPEYAVFLAEEELSAPQLASRLCKTPGVLDAEVQLARLHAKRSMPNDPLVAQQWHLNNTNPTRTHLNIAPVWAYGSAATPYRGNGIRIGIVDDGLQTNHPDLAPNVDTENDRDWNGNDYDPSPGNGDDHGTAVAGVAAARGNNALGVSGTAPEATLVGMRLIAAFVNDSQEADAMNYRNDIIQVKNNSWGPDDTGDTLEGPGPLTLAALANATASGRSGRGTIFVWAGGNGGDVSDNSNYDGYANSIYTIAVGATDSTGNRSYYSEPGANIVVCTPSSGNYTGITTTDRTGSLGYNTATSASGGDYTDDFGGTSSATPALSGVIALMLQRNPNLGWRDVQEILIRSAYKVQPTDPGWSTNSAGLSFHHDFGAGLADATAAVNLAATWTNLAAQQSLSSNQSGLSVSIPNNNATGITRSFSFSGPAMRVEHVTVRISITHTARGNLESILTSPSGMTSRLAEVRPDTNDNYTNWTFSTVRHWGENSTGNWTLKIADRSNLGNTTGGTLTSVAVTIYGTPIAPVNQRPTIHSASLNASGQSFADTALAITSISATDPEQDPISFQYQWQRSSDGTNFTDFAGATVSSLPASPSLAGWLWRCAITPSDPNGAGPAFYTPAVNTLLRPPPSVIAGNFFSYQSGLVLRNAEFSRQAIVHEFSQGPSGGTSEWVELLTLKPGSLVGWELRESASDRIVFKNAALWANLPAGTLIVIYNGSSKDTLLPPDDTDPSDGNLVVSSTDTSLFESGTGFSSWISLGNTGDAILLRDPSANLVHGISYGSSGAASPNIGPVGSGQAACFTGANETDTTSASAWQVVSATINQLTNPTQNGVTPAAANTPANSNFIAGIRDGTAAGPALFRIASGSNLPPGLSINATTGFLSGTVSPSATPGSYAITIERYNSLGEQVSQSFALEVLAPNSFAAWTTAYPSLGFHSGKFQDADGDGIPNLLEHLFGSRPDLPTAASPTISFASPTSLTLRHTRTNQLAEDVAYEYQWSTDLVNWFVSGATNTEGIRVVITPSTVEDRNAPDNDVVEATASVQSGSPNRIFLRIRAW